MLALLFVANAFGYQDYENFKYIYIYMYFSRCFKIYELWSVVDLQKKKKERKGKINLEISSKEAIKKPLILVRAGEGMFGWLV